MKKITAAELAAADMESITLIDLRERSEFAENCIPGSVNMPFSEIWTCLSEVPDHKPVYVMCRTGDISREIVEVLEDRGYDAYNVEGGFAAYTVYRAVSEG